MKFFDAFSGIGGFHLGIKQSHPDWECIGNSEIDKYADIIYKKHFPEVMNYGDITKLERLPEGTEMFCGGFPCQAFSIAGKRGGFGDTRGTLFFEIARLCEISKPKIIFLENVKGLLNHDRGETFRRIITTLMELGYCVEWQVLNSKNFGVPQNRERVFIVGHFGEEPERKVFPLRQSNSEIDNGMGEERKDCAWTLRARDYKDGTNFIAQINKPTHAGDRVYCANGISPSLRARAREDATSSPKIIATYRHSMEGFKGYEDYSPSIKSSQGSGNQIILRQPLRFLNRNQNNIEGDYSFTVDSSNTGGVKVDDRIRRLTPLECERLQGFPDGWTEGLSDSQRYKCLGNAVSVNVIREIVKEF